jgi:HEPN domain-containing protein
MSAEKNLQEARRWLETAKGDIEAADVLLRNGKYAHACFHAQQSAEKALKALWFYADADPWGHSISKLIEKLSEIDPVLFKTMEPLKDAGVILDRHYIPTRYPNGLPDITPEQAFLKEDAVISIDYSRNILNEVQTFL